MNIDLNCDLGEGCPHDADLMPLIRVNQDVWLPKHVTLKLDARIALLKGLNIDEDITYRDYKKFRTDIKILPWEELKD